MATDADFPCHRFDCFAIRCDNATNTAASFTFKEFKVEGPPLPPTLSAVRTTTNTVCVWWPVPDTAWQLQATTNLATTGSVWTTRAYTTNAGNCIYIESPPTGNRFYRLNKP